MSHTINNLYLLKHHKNSFHKGQNQSTYLMKMAMKMQPSSETVEADSTTTITLPAMLTRAPSPAPTMI